MIAQADLELCALFSHFLLLASFLSVFILLLSTPDWGSMEGGLYGQTGKLYQVRVTVLVGTKDRVVEKKAIQAAIMPPPAPT